MWLFWKGNGSPWSHLWFLQQKVLNLFICEQGWHSKQPSIVTYSLIILHGLNTMYSKGFKIASHPLEGIKPCLINEYIYSLWPLEIKSLKTHIRCGCGPGTRIHRLVQECVLLSHYRISHAWVFHSLFSSWTWRKLQENRQFSYLKNFKGCRCSREIICFKLGATYVIK